MWAAAGHDRATLQGFFDLLGPARAAKIRLVSADAAEWIGDCALAACPNATLCLDPFHICRWASQALDVVRRWIWNVLRRLGLGDRARQLKGCRYALWKNPEGHAAKLAWIAKHNHRLYRACLLKEQLRLVFAYRGPEAVAMLDAWLAWARRSQIPAFIQLYHRIKKHRAGIVASVTHGLSNGLTESVNTKLRSPAWPTGSAPPTTSSPSASSTEAATAHPYPAGTDPRKGTESRISGRRPRART